MWLILIVKEYEAIRRQTVYSQEWKTAFYTVETPCYKEVLPGL